MADETVSVGVEAEVEQAIKDFKRTEDAVDGFGDAMDESAGTAQSMQDALNAINTVAGKVNMVIQYAMKAYNAVVAPTVEYANEIDSLSQILGLGAEETSRLIKITEDFGIQENELESIMKNAAKNGVDPSIEGLKALAEEYLAIENPLERTKLLMETFGESGASMGRLLETGSVGISRMAQAAENSGMVMSQQSVDAAMEYAAAMDEFKDVVHGVTYAIGSGLLPVLTEILGPLNEFFTEINKVKNDINDQVKAIAMSSPTYEEFTQRIMESGVELLLWSELSDNYVSDQLKMKRVTADFSEELYNSIVAEDEAESQIRALSIAQTDYAVVLSEVDAAQRELENKQRSWLEGTGSELARLLGDLNINNADYMEGLQAIDEVYGTSTEAEQLHKDALEEMIRQYYKTRDIDAFKTALSNLKDTELPKTTEELEKARSKAAELEGQIAALQEMAKEPITFRVNIETYGNTSLLTGIQVPP